MGVPLKVESWVWYALGISLVCCRILSRSLLFGTIKKLKVDDYLMMATVVPYTALIITMNIVANSSSNLIPPGTDVQTLSPTDIRDRIYGSKLTVVVEQMQCITVWSLKACLIFLYYRLTVNLPAHKAVMILICYVAVTFVVMEILYFGVWCRPFYNYWAVPTPNIQCSAAIHHLITNAAFNLSSDVAMLFIGFSLFVRSKLPWSRKIILCCIFSLGVFVILAAVLNKYYSFTHPFGSQWTFWYIRESSTAMLVANLPFTWTLLRRMFKLQAFDGQGTVRSVPYHSSRTARGRHVKDSPRHSRGNTLARTNGHNGSNKSGSKHGSHNSSLDMKQVSRSPSSPLDMSFAGALGPGGRALPPSGGEPLPLPKPVQKANWKERGLYGREDLELMLEPWDVGNDGDVPIRPTDSISNPRDSMSNYGGRNRAISAASNRESLDSSHGSPGSPGSGKRMSRRIRDEEAQYALQEDVGVRCHYYEGPPDWTSDGSEMAGIAEEGVVVDSPNSHDLTQEPPRPSSAEAEQKSPMLEEEEMFSHSRDRCHSVTN